MNEKFLYQVLRSCKTSEQVKTWHEWAYRVLGLHYSGWNFVHESWAVKHAVDEHLKYLKRFD